MFGGDRRERDRGVLEQLLDVCQVGRRAQARGSLRAGRTGLVPGQLDLGCLALGLRRVDDPKGPDSLGVAPVMTPFTPGIAA